MGRRFKRILSVLLVVVMIVGSAPLSGFAGLELPNLADLFTLKADAATYSGKCGDNLTWSLDTDTGVLTISGTGDMYNEDYPGDVPWTSNRSSVKTVVIGDSVTSIGEYAFEYCTKLTSVTIGNSVTSIGSEAFWGCTGLTSVTIPDSVTSIDDLAFYNCTGLTSITIPDSVTSIGESAFVECTGLTSITVKEGNPNYSSDEYGVLFNKDKTMLIQYPIGNTRTSYTIPDSVTSIGESAFEKCTGLTNVTIPDSVTSIGNYAFYTCKGLTSVTIPDSVTSIGEYAFFSCTGLTSVTIPDSVTSIDDLAFYNCTGLTSVTIPDSVTSIGEFAFEYCTGLTSITVKEGNPKYSSDEYGVLFNKDKTLLIQYPIGNTRTSYTIPDSVTSIGYGAFGDCNSLTSVAIPDSVTSIGNYAFYTCKGLTSVTIPDSVTSIGEYAFFSCTGLTSVTIGNSVTSIGSEAFWGCTGLTSVTIPDSVTSIGNYAFYKCKGLTSVTIPDSVTSIGEHAFEYCTGLTSVTIGNNVTSIGNYAFYRCKGLTSVTIPDSVTSIGEHAFEYCTGLTSVTIGNNVTSIGTSAFAHCTGLTDVYYTGTEEEWHKISIDSYNECLTNATIHFNSSIIEPEIKDVTNKEVEFKIDGYNGKVTINFKNSWFEKSPYKYNHELARFCADYSMLGYVYNEKTVKSYLKHAGFSDFYSVSGNMHTGRDEVNYFLASRDISVNGKIQKLIFMGTIGSYKNQWYSNFDPLGYENANKDKSLADGGKTHRGFADAREYAYSKLSDYISQLVVNGTSKNDIKLLLTGHSRGAATANLLAAKLIDEESTFGISRNNIYTYTFATPNVTKKNTTADKYKCIFNIVNPEDFVTKVMLNKWRFSRYGVTYTLPSKTNIGKKNYNALLSGVKNKFNKYTGKEFDPYKMGEVKTYKVISSMGKNVTSAEALYTEKFWYDLNVLIPRKKDVFSFFKNTLLNYLVNENMDEIKKVLLEGGPFYLNILAYFAWPDIDMDSIHISIPGYLIDGLSDIELGGKFKMAHQMQTYAAYMNTMTEAQVKEYKAGYKNTVNCPVDIEVYDSEGTLVGRIVDNVVDETVENSENAIVMDVEGDSKSFWLPSNEEFTIKLIGNDNGTMDYTVAAVDSDTGETERVNFFDVDIVKGQAMTGEVNADEFALEKYTLEKETGETVEPTEQTDDIAEVEIKTSVFGKGTVSESTTATSGDYVTVYATPDEGYVFKGWYDGNKLISTDAEYSFVAKENTSLTARFEPAEYTATLMVDGKVYKEITYTYGQKSITLPEVPAKAGFKGEWESYSLVAGGVTINAIYTALSKVNSVSVGDLSLNYKMSASLNPTISSDDGAKYTVTYTSSDTSVARVDENGKVYGAKRGSADITVTVTDEYGNTVSDTCKVNVTYAWWQWIIVIVLFGWIWY